MSAAISFSTHIHITANGTYYSDVKDMGMFSAKPVLAAAVSSYVNGDYTVTLQHTPDAGVHWVDVDSLAAISSNTALTKSITANLISIVRLKIVAVNVVAGAVVDAYLFWDKE